MPAPQDPPISAKLLSGLFARFTADRDALFAAVERCEQRLVDLSERLGAAGEDAPGGDDKADQALAVAQEALAVAREALAAVRNRRG
jgi:hypothetical protein